MKLEENGAMSPLEKSNSLGLQKTNKIPYVYLVMAAIALIVLCSSMYVIIRNHAGIENALVPEEQDVMESSPTTKSVQILELNMSFEIPKDWVINKASYPGDINIWRIEPPRDLEFDEHGIPLNIEPIKVIEVENVENIAFYEKFPLKADFTFTGSGGPYTDIKRLPDIFISGLKTQKYILRIMPNEEEVLMRWILLVEKEGEGYTKITYHSDMHSGSFSDEDKYIFESFINSIVFPKE